MSRKQPFTLWASSSSLTSIRSRSPGIVSHRRHAYHRHVGHRTVYDTDKIFRHVWNIRIRFLLYRLTLFGKPRETRKELERVWLDKLIPIGSGTDLFRPRIVKTVPLILLSQSLGVAARSSRSLRLPTNQITTCTSATLPTQRYPHPTITPLRPPRSLTKRSLGRLSTKPG